MIDMLNSRQDVTLGALFLEFAKIGLCGIGSLLRGRTARSSMNGTG
jgi:hypothetical protein